MSVEETRETNLDILNEICLPRYIHVVESNALVRCSQSVSINDCIIAFVTSQGRSEAPRKYVD